MYIGDLHIHSRYSRATSKELTPEQLDLWARKKGIDIIGTGDFTHQAWRSELEQKLEPAEPGLYVLKKELTVPHSSATGGRRPRFVISGEISSIYKKNGKVRKVHSLILLPSLEAAEALSRRLEAIGNIHSDGRPILGLDCHDLLAITLDVCPEAIYVPAHIWTPHFSLFGAFSGFNTIEECYEELTPHIHALETGLSSDPSMNWRLSALDSYQLISNSDAHSPAKLGREANLFDITMSYEGLYGAIQRGEGMAGTIEFFPEEGKYHFDGHRKCHLSLSPSQARQYKGICPVCGKKLTTGVLHRIEQLADRQENFRLPGGRPYENLVPLPEVIASCMGISSGSVKVSRQYEHMLEELGNEFHILRKASLDDIGRIGGQLTAQGIRHLREGQVAWRPGYDGEYGTMKLFRAAEIDSLEGQLSFLTGLNSGQRQAVQSISPVTAAIAGPGTGKTKTLVSRIAYLIGERGVKPSEITAVTFTNKAAEELRQRIHQQLPGKSRLNQMQIGTFHSLCYQMLLNENTDLALADEGQLEECASQIVEQISLSCSPNQFLTMVSLHKSGTPADADMEEAFHQYDTLLSSRRLMDSDDLLLNVLKLLESEQKFQLRKQHFFYLMVDEFQNINPIQYRLIQAWFKGGKELFLIGDPDQSICGSQSNCFDLLDKDYEHVNRLRLTANYSPEGL